MNRRRAVITGIGVISPNAIGKDKFWQALKEGRSGIKPITVFDPALLKTKLGGEVLNFKPEEFLGDKGLRNLNRSALLVCSASKLALEDSGLLITEENTDQIGVVTATTLSAVFNIAALGKEMFQDGPGLVNPAMFPGTTINSPSSQISIRHNIKGFNTTISTGYSASLDALKYAIDFINLGRAKAVLVAATEGLTFENYIGFYKIGFLAGLNGEEVSCPFDKRRNGIILAEAAAVLVVEEEEYARNRGVDIYAEILATESLFDAYRAGKYHPRLEGLRQCMTRAMKTAELHKEDISYISASANSVIQQDKLETEAIKEILGVYSESIPVSAIKSMVGESVSATGLLQVAAACGSIKHGFIPPTINYSQKDPDCDLDYVPNESRQQRIENVLVNNFGPGGNNAVAIISKY